jgi:hypothetical protein
MGKRPCPPGSPGTRNLGATEGWSTFSLIEPHPGLIFRSYLQFFRVW